MSAESVLTAQLKAMHAQCLGLAHTIEAVLAMTAPDPAMAADVPPCEHPPMFRLPMPSMGHPTRFRCQSCGEEVDA